MMNILGRKITATGTEATLTADAPIRKIVLLVNDSSDELTFAIRSTVAAATEKIYLKTNEKIENLEIGSADDISYVSAGSSSEFRIIAELG